MTDLSNTIAPKSDQLNADDLIVGPITVRITKVSANPGSAEQPISVFFEGDNGKPYKPCKSMRRVLVQVWGKNGAEYIGKSMTLFRDPSVQFGGVAVGGIRISHMSGIDKPAALVLTANRASRKPYTVEPLTTPPRTAGSNGNAFSLEERTATLVESIRAKRSHEALDSAMRKGAVLRSELEAAGRGMLLDQIEAAFNEQDRAIGERKSVEREPGDDQ